MKTYPFKVIVESDEERWHAYCPVLEQYGAATWGETREEALKHIQEVVRMVVEELAQDGVPLPQGPKEEVEVFEDTRDPRLVTVIKMGVKSVTGSKLRG